MDALDDRRDAGVLVLSAGEVSRLFGPAAAIESQRVAFTALGQGTALLPDKLVLDNPADGSVALCYAARVSPDSGPVSKFVSVNPGNVTSGLPSVSAVVVALDPVTGRPAAIMDGTVVTTRRTAAASAVAADVLARPDATELAVIGCGVQGREHVRMLSRVRSLGAVRLWAPTPSHRRAAAQELAAETGLAVRACDTAQDAVAGADVVCLCTLSFEPVVEAGWLAAGATVIAVGSFAPDRCEVGPDVVAAARVVVDHPPTAAGHAGPILRALRSGPLTAPELTGLGDVLVGRAAGRTSPDQLVFYNSTGLGTQDAAAATTILAAARRQGIGRRITLT